MVQEAVGPAATTAPVAGGLRIVDGGALDPLVQPQCSLAVHLRRAEGSIVGRTVELGAIAQELREATTRLTAVTLEGEPGIGKTRLLVAAAELATAAGFTTVAITADEEIRGPFLVARSLFANGAIRDTATGGPAEPAVRRVVQALSGRDEAGYETLSPDAKLLRAFDLGGVALGALAAVRPLALLIDDVQWADDDTLRMLRYAVRSVADSPIFLFLTVRPDEFATVPEAVNLVADMERMGLVRRLRPGRFSSLETGELLGKVLGGPVDAASAAAMHAQSEGVPFIVEELARTHRDAGTLQLAEGEWRLGRNAARLVPSAVRTLIGRRAARLPAACRDVLADAAILGRSFSLRDLAALRARLDGTEPGNAELADDLRPAVDAGLLLQQAEGQAADYTFSHEQVRQFATSQLSQARRRQVHRAVVDLLLEGGEPDPASLPMLAQHALAGADTERAARFSIDAAAAALQSNAPEEALRLVEGALPLVSDPSDRRVLLTTRDDAYAVLRRSADRLEGLAELGALAEALRDRGMELDVQLRRAAALRIARDEDAAAELARRVRTRAAELGDPVAELRAALELGQALQRAPLGESYGGTPSDVDLDAAEEAFRRAAELAEGLGDERSLAAATRELGTIVVARIREWFATNVREAGLAVELDRRITGGEPIESVLGSMPIAPQVRESMRLFEKALAIFERLDDRTGVMSTVIAMAYINYAPVIHLTSSARHLEEIRRVTSRLTEMVTESERARQELQMLYGVHVYARAKVVPDLMLSRGEEAHRAARLQGDRSTEFLSAGGVALSQLELGDPEAAERWLGMAAEVVAAAPTPSRSRQLEIWRGMACAARDDAQGMREHLEQAVALATEQGRPAVRCETLARLALEVAGLGARSGDEDLLELAERSAIEARELAARLPGHPPWSAQAEAAIAQVALARGDRERAAASGAAAMEALQHSFHEDMNLDILIPACGALLAGGAPEVQASVRSWLQVTLTRIAHGTLDEGMRVRWLRGPTGRKLVELAGTLDEAALATVAAPAGSSMESPNIGPSAARVTLDEVDRRVLRLLTEGSTNAEMAAQLGMPEADVGLRLARLFAALGATTRAEATSLAFRGFAY